MSDNVIIPASGTGDATPTIATDDVSSVHYQKVKLDGGDNGLSVPIVAGQQLAAGSLPVVLTAAQITTLTPVAALTDTQLRATPVPVSGTVTASGPLTDTQLRATAVPVSGTVTTGGLTDTQLRATAVPISLATAPTTPVTGTFFQATQPVSEADGVNVTLGAKADAKSTATDTTPITAMSVLKQISASVQAPPSQAVTNSGTFAVQAASTVADGANAVEGVTTGAKVITDANGTIQQYLRGLIYLLITTANFPTKQMFGTSQTVISTATDIAAGNFSGAPTTYDNTTDAAVPYARYAVAVLAAPDWAAAPVAGTTVDLYGVIQNCDGSSDETDAPSGTSSGGAHYFGSWYIAAADALQRRAITIDLLGVTAVDFYIKNNTAQNMNNDGGTSCVVKVIPLALGVVA